MSDDILNDQDPSRSARPVLLALLLLLVAVAAVAALRVRERLAPLPVPARPPVAVEVLTLEPRPFSLARRYAGAVEAVRRVSIASRVSAEVLSVPHREGGRVSEGDLLARLDATELRQELERLEAASARIQAELDYWREQLARDEKLLAKGTVAERSRDESARQVAMLRASLTENAAARAIAATRLGYTEIRAPFAGTVQAVMLQPGAVAAPGQPLIEIVSDREVKVLTPVPQSDLKVLREGLPVRLRLPGAAPVLAAAVTGLYPALDPRTHTATLEVRLPEGTDGIRPGMELEVEVLLAQEARALVVPRESLRERDGETGVYLVDGDSARWRRVSIGPAAARELLVTQGLRPGDRLVVTPDPRLTDGEPLWLVGEGT